ncbi:MAG TPA: YggS family pyridoxal phosphate-dependent enzyme [Polyangiaceae bacterium]|nr:YggS family pyridoxal phosphate-dependent enzyme [Polyangiaceae bacterium]
MNDSSSITARLQLVRDRIGEAARTAQRDPTSIRLIAVSKGQSSQKIREAYAAGQREFGESYVQELRGKAEELSDLPDLRFHLIGHLQSNKARYAAAHCECVHTIDSPALVLELAKRRSALDKPPLGALVEVNIGREPQKHGVAAEAVSAVLNAVEVQPSLKLLGLMTIPPHTEDPQGALPYFDELRRLRDDCGGISRLPELSMGMSDDFVFAIKAGATLVRVGTGIFGPRTVH